MKTANVRMIIALSVFVAAYGMAQGNLTPPGAPSPTMKTLDQVEPRTPIASVPYSISHPGSYYLTTNLSSTSDGIVIKASDVTLDLMGFTLSGDATDSGYGVYLHHTTNSAIWNVVVRNGIVRDFGHGVLADYAQNSRFEHLITVKNNTHGIVLRGDDNGRCDGNTITDCTSNENGAYGIVLNGNSGYCNGNTIANCTIRGNGNYGILLTSVSAGQCDGNIIINCTIRDNDEIGISLNEADDNRVEGNHITGQYGGMSYGIRSSASKGNLIVRNTCVDQTANFSMSINDTYGPIVTNSGALPTTGAGAHPWANFSR